MEILFFWEGANSGLGLLCCCTPSMISVVGKTTCLSPEAKLKRDEVMNWRVSFCDVYRLDNWEVLIQQHFPQAAAVILSQPISPTQSAPKIACSSSQK